MAGSTGLEPDLWIDRRISGLGQVRGVVESPSLSPIPLFGPHWVSLAVRGHARAQNGHIACAKLYSSATVSACQRVGRSLILISSTHSLPNRFVSLTNRGAPADFGES